MGGAIVFLGVVGFELASRLLKQLFEFADVLVLGVCFAFNFAEEIGAIFNEKRVVKNYVVQGAPALVEIVHVELPDERVHVAVSEENRKDGLFELLFVQNFKAQPVGGPADYSFRFFFLTSFKKLEKKRRH